MSHTFDLDTAKFLYDSTDRFPVDLDLAWAWIGYSKKQNALIALLSDEFDEDVDFSSSYPIGYKLEGRPSDKYFLSVDCFKTLAMMARTKFGKQIRRYFLECEKTARASVQRIAALESEILRLTQNQAIGIFEKATIALLSLIEDLHGCKGDPLATSRIGNTIDSINAVLSRNKPIGDRIQVQAVSIDPSVFRLKARSGFKLTPEHREKLKAAQKARHAKKARPLWFPSIELTPEIREKGFSNIEIKDAVLALEISGEFALQSVSQAIFCPTLLSRAANMRERPISRLKAVLGSLGFEHKRETEWDSFKSEMYGVKRALVWGKV